MQRRVIWAWCMYDWANSAYPLVISTALFPVYFNLIARDHPATSHITFAGHLWQSSSLYALTIALSYAINAILVPVLSGIADWGGRKKKFLNLFCTLGAISCAGLALFDRSTLHVGLAAAMLASIGFNGSLVFYNAFLPEIAPPRLHDRISARGYIVGYIGSSLLLIGILALLLFSSHQGMADDSTTAFLVIAPWAFVAVGLWWRLFAQLTLSLVPEGSSATVISVTEAIRRGLAKLRDTLTIVWRDRVLKLFLVGYLAASMGVQSVILLASLFGKQELGLDESLLIGVILLVQFVAAGGSWLCARLSERWGNTLALIVITLIWTLLCIAAYGITSSWHFVLLSASVGSVLGGIQSQMRSTFSKLIADQSAHASLFSLYDIAEKVGTTTGMGSFSLVVGITGSLRLGALMLAIAFIVTAVLLTMLHHTARMHPIYRRITLPQHAR